MITKQEAFDTVIAVGFDDPEMAPKAYRGALMKTGAPHQRERLPAPLCADLVRYGTHTEGAFGLGLLTLVLGCANWGVYPGPVIASNGRGTQCGVLADPAGDDWRGRPERSGKHLMDGSADFPWGGLALPHFDSSALLAVYDSWGWPGGSKSDASYRDDRGRLRAVDFNSVLRSGFRDEWLRWSTALLRRVDFHRWTFSYWLAKFWEPIWRETAAAIGGSVTWPEIVASASMNARFANSAKGAAKKARGLPAAEVEAAYLKYKSKRSERAVGRAKRQIAYTKRVAVVYEAAHIEAL